MYIMKLKFKVVLLLFIGVTCSSWTGRNILEIWISGEGRFLVEGKIEPLSRVCDIVKLYVLNPDDLDQYPEKREIEVPYFGIALASKTVVSIQCDRDTKYGEYIALQNEVERAFNEMRNDLALRKFGVPYLLLSQPRQKAINMIIPKRISEAEPNYVRNARGNLVENKMYWWYFVQVHST